MNQYLKSKCFVKISFLSKQKVLVTKANSNNVNLFKNHSKKLTGEIPSKPLNLNEFKGLDGAGATFSKKFDTAYSKLSEVKLITIGLASPEKIRQWAEKTLPNKNKTVFGQVTNANTLHHKTFKPQKGGLFCERIFGPLKDFQCACGITIPTPVSSNLIRSNITNGSVEQPLSPMEFLSKPMASTLKGPTAQVTRKFCNKCDVEYTWSVIRRYQLGYIQLVSPVTHVWYLKGSPSYLSILLDMKKRHLEYVTYCTESLTLENSIKTNTSRLTKIPSQMLELWKETVVNSLPLVKSQNKNKELKSYELYKERKKKKRLNTAIPKRVLPLVLTSALENVFSLNSENNQIPTLTVKLNKKFLILLSLIHKHVYLSNLIDFKNELIESILFDCFDKFSLKQLLKKLPTSLYLFYNLQLVLQKEFFLLLCNKFWKELYLTSLQESLQNNILLSNSLKWDNQQKNNLDTTTPFYSHKVFKMEQMKSLFYSIVDHDSQYNYPQQSIKRLENLKKLPGCTPISTSYKETLTFIEIAKQQWFLTYLLCIKKLKSTDLLQLNYALLTNNKLTNQQLRNSITQNVVNFSLLNRHNSDKNNGPVSSFNYSVCKSVQPMLNKYSNVLNHAIFNVFLKQLTFVDKKYPVITKKSSYYNSLLSETQKKSSTKKVQSVGSADTYAFPIRDWEGITEKKNHLLSYIFLANVKKQYSFLFSYLRKEKAMINFIFSFESVPYVSTMTNFSSKESSFLKKNGRDQRTLVNTTPQPSNDLLGVGYGEFSSSLYYSLFLNKKIKSINSLPKSDNIYKESAFISQTKKAITKPQKNEKKLSHSKATANSETSQKLVNNIYCVSHRERWMDEEWQNFIDYMSMPFNVISKKALVPNNSAVIRLKPQWDNASKGKELQSGSFLPLGPLSLLSYDERREKVDRLNNRLDKNSFSSIPNIFNKDLSIIPAYKNRIFVLKNEFSSLKGFNKKEFGNQTNLNVKANNYQNNAEYSGPGIIQQLLNELDFSELQKIDKQNRILLYQLNKYIFALKKRLTKAAKKELKDCYKKRDQLIRRTKLIRTFFRKDSKPNSMILKILPVLPPDLRPIVKIGGQIAASDLNRLYQRVIYRNDRLKKFLKEPGMSSSYEMKYAQRLLQEAVDNLIQNGKSGSASEKDARGRALKSLSDLLKGKQGRFRQYLLGKRVDYSGRSVIVVGPQLKLHECGLPKEMAVELYLPFLLKRILNHNYARTIVGAKTLMKLNPDLVWELLKEIMQTCPVLLNRAPTLHRLGIQAFQPKLIEGRAILLHPLVCPAFNADFDGDQMAVHVPITVEARAEAWKLMCGRQNILSPATGEPLAIPSQDMVLGCYYLTTHCNKSTIKYQQGSGFYFNNFSDVLNAYRRQIVDLHAFVWVKFDGHLEQGNDQDDPIEIRINIYGQWTEIYQYIQNNYSKNNTPINQYICTTPGRILFNFIIKKNFINPPPFSLEKRRKGT